MTMMPIAPAYKEMPVAYALWLCLGWTGAHRFYLGQIGSGLGQTALLVASVLMLPIIPLWIGMISWWLVDAFMIPMLVRDANASYQPVGMRVGEATDYELDQLKAWNQIAVASSEQGDQAGAISVSLKALQQAERLMGYQHPLVGVIKSNLGEYYRLYGDLVLAHRMMVDAIAIKQAGHNSLDVVATLSNLVLVYIATQQYGEAEQVLLHMQQLLLSNKDTSTLYYHYLVTLYHQFGQLAVVQGHFEQALPWFEAGAAQVGRLPEDNAGLKLRMLISTGHALMGLSQTQRAAEYYQRALTLHRHGSSQISADVTASLTRLAQALQQQGVSLEGLPEGNPVSATDHPVQPVRPYVVSETEMIPFDRKVEAAQAPAYVPIGSVVDLRTISVSNIVLDKTKTDDEQS